MKMLAICLMAVTIMAVGPADAREVAMGDVTVVFGTENVPADATKVSNGLFVKPSYRAGNTLYVPAYSNYENEVVAEYSTLGNVVYDKMIASGQAGDRRLNPAIDGLAEILTLPGCMIARAGALLNFGPKTQLDEPVSVTIKDLRVELDPVNLGDGIVGRTKGTNRIAVIGGDIYRNPDMLGHEVQHAAGVSQSAAFVRDGVRYDQRIAGMGHWYEKQDLRPPPRRKRAGQH